MKNHALQLIANFLQNIMQGSENIGLKEVGEPP